MNLDRSDNSVVCEELRSNPVETHLTDQRSFLDLVNENNISGSFFEFGGDAIEEAHFVNGLDVFIDQVRIERMARRLGNVNANSVAFNSLIPLDLDFRDDWIWSLCRGITCEEQPGLHESERHEDSFPNRSWELLNVAGRDGGRRSDSSSAVPEESHDAVPQSIHRMNYRQINHKDDSESSKRGLPFCLSDSRCRIGRTTSLHKVLAGFPARVV